MSSTSSKKSGSTEIATHTLFMSKIEKSHDDQGIMNLGKNCHFCHRLDFLPFHCEFCNGTFCSAHRTLDIHNCTGRPQKKPSVSGGNSQIYDGPTAASLFPDRTKHQKSLDASLEKGPIKPRANSTPLMKLTKFLHLQRLKRESKKKSLSIFGKSSSKTPSLTVEVAKIKKTAKGPNSVNVSDRVYVWTLFVNRNEEDFGEISEENERKALWVSKAWSVGRALDSIAETMNIMNHNNTTQQNENRLNLFKVEKDTPVALTASAKVNGTIPNGATLYLVRGAT